MPTLVAEASEATYEDVQKMIYKLCWNHSKDATDWEECLSTAHLAYAQAYRSFDPERSQFITWAYVCIDRALRSRHRVRRAAVVIEGGPMDRLPARPVRHTLDRIGSDLSEDARLVVRLVIEAPEELSRIVRSRNHQNSRRLLWGHLRDLGWTMARVVESFEEIREALVE